MDFLNRDTQPQPVRHNSSATPVATHAPAGASAPAPEPKHPRHKYYDGPKDSKLIRTGAVVLLFALTVLVVSVIGMIYYGNSNNDQSKFVRSSNFQAVFLTNGQGYFGKITEISKDYVRLNNVYYLTQNTTTDSKGNTTSDGSYTLVKLGCQQIHDPFDQMIIQRSQVSFWENIQDDGKVVKSISDYQTQNKNKTQAQICSTVSTQTQASSTSSNQQGGTTTGTTSTTPKNP